MWERTLQDLIRGLRANKNDERKFVTQAIEEIRKETKSKDMELKAGAILKMTFLDMLGYDLTWANFHIIEVMSSSKYHLKTVGYLAASQSFNQETDVLMLTTNLLKKDLSSLPTDTALALAGLSQFVTPDLARDLTQELNAMLNHSRAAIRKRVVLALFKVIRQYPEALPYCLPRLKEKLEDPDPSVVSSTVNLFCELARRNPQDFLVLAPPLFHILTTCSNNWMLIKVIKLFGAISPYEPRLVKKLQGPITDLIQSTSAISLLYECVHTCIIGGMLDGFNGLALARLCVTQLSTFLENSDQNLKYIALNAMAKIVPIRPELVAEHQAIILSSLEDFDTSIRMRALELVSSMASPNNTQFLIQQLLSHLAKSHQSSLPSATATLSRVLQTGATTSEGTSQTQTQVILSPAYRLEITNQIINMCSRNMYENVQDFDWYLSVLLDLVYVAGTDVASTIREQLVNVTARVQDARNYACRLMVRLLDDDSLLLNADDPNKCSGVLWAAAWICGEYGEELSDPHYALQRLIQPSVSLLPSDIIAVYMQAILKVFARWCSELVSNWANDSLPRIKKAVGDTLDFCHSFVSHEDIEVQERAANATQLFTMIKMDLDMFKPQLEIHPRLEPEPEPEPEESNYPDFANAFSDLDPTRNPPPTLHPQTHENAVPSFPKSLLLLQHLFSYSFRSVTPDAQTKVQLPDGLDLNEWFVPPPKQELEVSDNRERKKKKAKGKAKNGIEKGKSTVSQAHTQATHTPYTEDQPEREEGNIAAMRAERLARQREDPYYLKDSRPTRSQRSTHDIDSIPIVKLDDMPPLIIGPDRSTPSSRPREIISAAYHESFETSAGSASESGSRSASPYPTEAVGEGAAGGLLSPDTIVVKRTKKKTSGKKKTIESSL